MLASHGAYDQAHSSLAFDQEHSHAGT